VGTQDAFCGSGGVTCQACTPTTNGGHCVADAVGGHCEDIGECNATNCAGCCAGKLCVVGTQPFACGSGGAACQDCTSDAGLCSGLVGADGTVARGCGYDCMLVGPGLCFTFCSTADDCMSLTSKVAIPR
jgi:hypothetical protein